MKKNNNNLLIAIFSLSFFLFVYFIKISPSLTQNDKESLLIIPKKPRDLLIILEIIQKYTKNNNGYMYFMFSYLYILQFTQCSMQSFAIPGPIILSILASPLFGFYKGLLVVSCCSTSGATICYLLSQSLGKNFVMKKFPKKLKYLQEKVLQNKDKHFWLMIFLRLFLNKRLTPILPNWFVNVSAPIVNIKLQTFIIGTFIGLIPANIIHLNTGLILDKSSQIGLDYKSILLLFVLGLLSLIPILFKQKKIKE